MNVLFYTGRQYDEEGRLNDWWDPQSSNNFGITTECMVDQYNRYNIKGQRIDGDFTLDENIADNGGLRAAHYVSNSITSFIEMFKTHLNLSRMLTRSG